MREKVDIPRNNELPNDWDLRELRELCVSILDGTHQTPRYVSDGVPFYSVENISTNNFNDCKFISEEEHIALIKRCRPEIGDILMTRIGSLGETKLIDWAINASIYVSLALIKVNTETDSSYLYQYTKSEYFKNEVLKRSLLTAYPQKINLGEIGKTKIMLPKSKKEQEIIAEILSTVDEKIDVIDAQITQTQELKKGMMQRLLTKGIGHTQFKDSPLGEIPESWKNLRLENVATKIGDGLHSTPKYVENSEWHFINGNNLVEGKIIITEKTKCISESEFIKHHREIEADTVLMSINGTIGNLAYYKGEKVILGKSAAFISCGTAIDKSFLYYLLQSTRIKQYYDNELTGTTIGNLSLKSIRNTPITLPPKEEQEKIVKILVVVDEKINLMEKRKNGYATLKKALMQQLLTGRLRVNHLIKNPIPA